MSGRRRVAWHCSDLQSLRREEDKTLELQVLVCGVLAGTVLGRFHCKQ